VRIRSIAFALAATALFAASAVHAADYPSKPIRVILPFAAGGITDAMARLVADKLQPRIGQPLVMETKPGANGVVGASAMLAAEPDGYTLMFGGGSAYTPVLINNLPFDFLRDFQPIAWVAKFPFALITNAQTPARTLPEFIAYAKANPGKLNSGGTGPTVMLAVEMLKQTAGIQLLHVPYKSNAESSRALLANEIQLAIDPVLVHRGNIAEGKLRALAVTTPERSSVLPEVQTSAEAGLAKFTMGAVSGFWGPAKMPREAVSLLNREINAVLNMPEVKDRVQALTGGSTMPGPPEAYRQFIQQDHRFWAEAAKLANYKPE
jgi:tripartite-type tricarboxylate transporter receptor subunit TctC